MMGDMDTDRRTSGDVRVFGCAECPRVSSVSARGWKAYRVSAARSTEPPRLAYYCPDCTPEGFVDEDVTTH